MHSDGSAQRGLDLKIALEVTGGDTQLLKELADLFLEECPAVLMGLRAAVKDKDAKSIETMAHKLKGSSTPFGAQSAIKAALQVETQGRNEDLEDIDQALAHLEQTYAPLLVELRNYQPD